jgi:hypothetical protein
MTPLQHLFKERLDLAWNQNQTIGVPFNSTSDEIFEYYLGFKKFIELDIPAEGDVSKVEPLLSFLDYTILCFQLSADEVSKYASLVSQDQSKELIWVNQDNNSTPFLVFTLHFLEVMNYLRVARLLLIRGFYPQAATIFRVYVEMTEALALSLVDFEFFKSFAVPNTSESEARSRWYKVLHPKVVHDRLIAICDAEQASGIFSYYGLLRIFHHPGRDRVVDFYSRYVHATAADLASYRFMLMDGQPAFRISSYPRESSIARMMVNDFKDFGSSSLTCIMRLLDLRSSGKWFEILKSQNLIGFETLELLDLLWGQFIDLSFEDPNITAGRLTQ